ncbi:ABC transporter permease subunit [Candidatus Parvarchaeota archaeon]|jgi:arabinogalactan oligomer/maltooligosaccharide transport system permease protein|nr:ABC transporter permease subunit [Candidatus Parvarchaeota archaeon]
MQINKYRVFDAVGWVLSYLLIILVIIFAIFPIYYIVLTSLSKLSSISELTLSSMIPSISSFTLSAYKYVLGSQLGLWLRNSLILAGGTTLLAVLTALIAGVALSRLNISGKKAIIIFLYVLTFFPFTAIVIPLFLSFSKLGLLNNYFGLIVIYASGTAIFGAYMSKIFIDSIPKEYEEAAMVDGQSRFKSFITIVFRIALPVVVFIALLAFIGAYTDYAVVNVFITKGALYTLMLGLYHVSAIGGTSAVNSVNLNVFSAFALLMGLPILVVFIVFQRYLTQMYSMSGTK